MQATGTYYEGSDGPSYNKRDEYVDCNGKASGGENTLVEEENGQLNHAEVCESDDGSYVKDLMFGVNSYLLPVMGRSNTFPKHCSWSAVNSSTGTAKQPWTVPYRASIPSPRQSN